MLLVHVLFALFLGLNRESTSTAAHILLCSEWTFLHDASGVDFVGEVQDKATAERKGNNVLADYCQIGHALKPLREGQHKCRTKFVVRRKETVSFSKHICLAEDRLRSAHISRIRMATEICILSLFFFTNESARDTTDRQSGLSKRRGW